MSAEKILVIRGGAVGDFVLILPALKAHRDRWPDRRVEILGYPATAALGPWFGVADDVRPLEHAALARFFVPGASLDPEWADYFASFDAVISYLYDPDGDFSTSSDVAAFAGGSKASTGPPKGPARRPFSWPRPSASWA